MVRSDRTKQEERGHKRTMGEKKRTAEEILSNQYKRQNKYIAEAFDRVSVALPKGTKEEIKATGESLNNFIKQAVADRLEKLKSEQQ